MGRIMRSCLQSILKLMNSVIGMVGIAMIMYSSWMLRVWLKNLGDSDLQAPWFIYTFLGLGITLCVITCSGHIAAETANGHCLSCYMVFVFLLVLLEAAVTADVFLNSNWEEDFPEDQTGRFDEFKDFVHSNFEMCKWIASLIVAAQALSMFLAMVLRALGPDRGSYYDSDDDYIPARLPLLKNQVPQPPYVVNPHYPLQNDAWNINR
ncbi:tetraspanin-19-like isoform X2 [Tasmannia lanceolata]|uniref:tetraspanin-19-like isoform X2 n=1 Tax=Tasmannia lanceolata TaxID=3420 RepID=UPI0040641F9D